MSFDVALLHKAVDWAKHEQKRKQRTYVGTLVANGEHTWRQNAWATLLVAVGWTKHTREVKGFTYDRFQAINPMTCGSTGCLAGHICVIAGDDYLIPKSAMPGEELTIEHVVDAEGNVHSIPDRAAQLLGTTSEGLGGLFEGSNGIEEIERIAKAVTEKHGEVW